jgi:hypothetical protein
VHLARLGRRGPPLYRHLSESFFENMSNYWKKVNVWSIKGPLLLLALILGFLDHILRWGGGVYGAGATMIIPIIEFRDFWNEARFWITVFLLILIQVPLVIELKPLIGRQGFPLMLAFGIFDCVLVASVLWWVCSGKSTRSV